MVEKIPKHKVNSSEPVIDEHTARVCAASGFTKAL